MKKRTLHAVDLLTNEGYIVIAPSDNLDQKLREELESALDCLIFESSTEVIEYVEDNGIGVSNDTLERDYIDISGVAPWFCACSRIGYIIDILATAGAIPNLATKIKITELLTKELQ